MILSWNEETLNNKNKSFSVLFSKIWRQILFNITDNNIENLYDKDHGEKFKKSRQIRLKIKRNLNEITQWLSEKWKKEILENFEKNKELIKKIFNKDINLFTFDEKLNFYLYSIKEKENILNIFKWLFIEKFQSEKKINKFKSIIETKITFNEEGYFLDELDYNIFLYKKYWKLLTEKINKILIVNKSQILNNENIILEEIKKKDINQIWIENWWININHLFILKKIKKNFWNKLIEKIITISKKIKKIKSLHLNLLIENDLLIIFVDKKNILDFVALYENKKLINKNLELIFKYWFLIIWMLIFICEGVKDKNISNKQVFKLIEEEKIITM